jgi:methanogenic corrinoid protein MtbC1
LHRAGFKISEIVKLTNSEIEGKVLFLSNDTFNSDNQIGAMITAMLGHNEKAINELLIKSIMNRGIEETFENIIFPFLRRIGIMWQTGSADIASEHFISSIFRQKLISSIDLLPGILKKGSKRVIMFLPENEYHEIGLLYFNYLIRKSGNETLYLGQSTPLWSVVELNKKWNADIIITGLMSGFINISPNSILSQLHESFPNQKVFVSGALADESIVFNYPNIYKVRSANDINLLFS